MLVFRCPGCGAELEIVLDEIGGAHHPAVPLMVERTLGMGCSVVRWSVLGCRGCRWAGWLVRDRQGVVQMVEAGAAAPPHLSRREGVPRPPAQ